MIVQCINVSTQSNKNDSTFFLLLWTNICTTNLAYFTKQPWKTSLSYPLPLLSFLYFNWEKTFNHFYCLSCFIFKISVYLNISCWKILRIRSSIFSYIFLQVPAIYKLHFTVVHWYSIQCTCSLHFSVSSKVLIET